MIFNPFDKARRCLMNKCVVQKALDSKINGLHVFFQIIETPVARICVDCKERGEGIQRQFNVVKVKKGCVTLDLTGGLKKSVESYLRKTFRHGEVLCFNCFEEYVDGHTTGFDPAN